MRITHRHGFTLVELIIVVTVISILAIISTVSYIGFQKQAVERTVQSDLDGAISGIQSYYRKTGEYPTTLPDTIETTGTNTIEITVAATEPYYETLTPVQEGVLFVDICEEQLAAGQGQGQNNGGQTMNYIVGCDVWDSTSMQIEAWETRQWTTPLNESTLINYANSYVSHDQQWNPQADDVVRAFYLSLIDTYKRRGGEFPVQSFWDFWANGSNGGVVEEPLPPATERTYFCVEGRSASYSDIVWHFTQEMRLEQGGC